MPHGGMIASRPAVSETSVPGCDMIDTLIQLESSNSLHLYNTYRASGLHLQFMHSYLFDVFICFFVCGTCSCICM